MAITQNLNQPLKVMNGINKKQTKRYALSVFALSGVLLVTSCQSKEAYSSMIYPSEMFAKKACQDSLSIDIFTLKLIDFTTAMKQGIDIEHHLDAATQRKQSSFDEPLPFAAKPPFLTGASKSLSEDELLGISKPMEDQYPHLSAAQLLHIQKIPTALVEKKNQVCSHEKHQADWAYVKLETFSQEEMKAVKTKSYVSIYPLCDGRDCVILRREPPSRVAVYRYK